jgi:hypothetical protein
VESIGCQGDNSNTIVPRWLNTYSLYLELLNFLKNTYFLAKNMKETISTIAPFFNIMPNGRKKKLL